MSASLSIASSRKVPYEHSLMERISSWSQQEMLSQLDSFEKCSQLFIDIISCEMQTKKTLWKKLSHLKHFKEAWLDLLKQKPWYFVYGLNQLLPEDRNDLNTWIYENIKFAHRDYILALQNTMNHFDNNATKEEILSSFFNSLPNILFAEICQFYFQHDDLRIIPYFLQFAPIPTVQVALSAICDINLGSLQIIKFTEALATCGPKLPLNLFGQISQWITTLERSQKLSILVEYFEQLSSITQDLILVILPSSERRKIWNRFPNEWNFENRFLLFQNIKVYIPLACSTRKLIFAKDVFSSVLTNELANCINIIFAKQSRYHPYMLMALIHKVKDNEINSLELSVWYALCKYLPDSAEENQFLVNVLNEIEPDVLTSLVNCVPLFFIPTEKTEETILPDNLEESFSTERYYEKESSLSVFKSHIELYRNFEEVYKEHFQQVPPLLIAMSFKNSTYPEWFFQSLEVMDEPQLQAYAYTLEAGTKPEILESIIHKLAPELGELFLKNLRRDLQGTFIKHQITQIQNILFSSESLINSLSILPNEMRQLKDKDAINSCLNSLQQLLNPTLKKYHKVLHQLAAELINDELLPPDACCQQSCLLQELEKQCSTLLSLKEQLDKNMPKEASKLSLNISECLPFKKSIHFPIPGFDALKDVGILDEDDLEALEIHIKEIPSWASLSQFTLEWINSSCPLDKLPKDWQTFSSQEIRTQTIEILVSLLSASQAPNIPAGLKQLRGTLLSFEFLNTDDRKQLESCEENVQCALNTCLTIIFKNDPCLKIQLYYNQSSKLAEWWKFFCNKGFSKLASFPALSCIEKTEELFDLQKLYEKLIQPDGSQPQGITYNTQ